MKSLQQTLQQNRALHRSTTHAVRHAADVELYSSTALSSALHLYSSTALYTLHPLHPPSGAKKAGKRAAEAERRAIALEKEVWVDRECRGGRRKGEGDCRPPPFAHLDAFV